MGCCFLLRRIFAALFLCVLSCVSSDITSDRAALVSLRSALGGRLLLWNLSDPVCSWAGVGCSDGDSAVVGIRFPGMGLVGALPADAISNLTNLQTLSLRFNSLSGELPAAPFSSLPLLRNLYLQNNFFTGRIPDSLFSATSLVRLNLANNDFSGALSPSFGNLSRLGTLYLENNRFTGTIPALAFAGLVQFNVSNNDLSGQIPASLSGQPGSSFSGNSLLCGAPLAPCQNGSPGKRLSGGAIAGIVIGSLLGLLLLILLLLFCSVRFLRGKGEKLKVQERGIETPGETAQRNGTEKKTTAAIENGGRALHFFGNDGWDFDLEQLLRSSAEVLGKGSFGTTYKALLGTGLAVAVKRLREVDLSENEFKYKINQIGRLDHRNLVPLKAYYYHRDEQLLVYDYLPSGSLSALLHGNRGGGRTPLNWETRAAIAHGAAAGISYIHSHGPSVSHGNVKSSNVLLTGSYEACVSDLGLARIAVPSTGNSRLAGFRAPEVTDPRNVSQSADVYSFGILLLELMTARAPADSPTNEDGVDLRRWVQSVVKEDWMGEVFDVELFRYRNAEEDMVQLVELALECTSQYPEKRPSMDVV
ncbi:hypothetical protein M569_14322, partial [Genlisea aurea]